MLGRLDYALMLDRGNNDLSRHCFHCTSNAQNGQIVGLRAAAGENQAVGLGASQVRAEDRGDSFPRVLQHPMGTLARLMLAGRIGITLGITTHHGLDNLRPGGSSGIVIEINGFHLSILGNFG
jgi:hypothetical protein